MSRMINAFAGPYAEWLIPRDCTSNWVNELPILEATGGLSYVACQGELVTVIIDGVEQVRFTFWPDERREGCPARDFYHGSFGWHAATVDLSAVDRQAEVRWFAKTFKEDLKQLAAHFGSEPQLRWGMLAWMQ
jgi:hypothetical protein